MHPAEPQDELLQCYDENGQPTESRTRAEVKALPPRYRYAVARVWLVNDAGQLMCSKRALTLTGNPGKWQSYFGGHVGAGYSVKDTAIRELSEEAGVSRSSEDLHLIYKGHNQDKMMFFENYAVRFNGQPSDLKFSDGEVTEAKWLDMDKYWQLQADKPDEWCNKCDPEQQQLIRAWLTSTMTK